MSYAHWGIADGGAYGAPRTGAPLPAPAPTPSRAPARNPWSSPVADYLDATSRPMTTGGGALRPSAAPVIESEPLSVPASMPPGNNNHWSSSSNVLASSLATTSRSIKTSPDLPQPVPPQPPKRATPPHWSSPSGALNDSLIMTSRPIQTGPEESHHHLKSFEYQRELGRGFHVGAQGPHLKAGGKEEDGTTHLDAQVNLFGVNAGYRGTHGSVQVGVGVGAGVGFRRHEGEQPGVGIDYGVGSFDVRHAALAGPKTEAPKPPASAIGDE